MNAQDRSELNITTLLLPERYKLSPYYQTLSSEMNDNEKALVMRWWLEKTRKNPDKFNPINKRTNLQRSLSDNFLSYILFHYYGRLSKPEMYVCREIIYAIWDSGDGIYDNIVSKLKENKTLFRTTHKVDSIIQRLMDKRVIYCKIHFRESKTDRLLKPKKIPSLWTWRLQQCRI